MARKTVGMAFMACVVLASLGGCGGGGSGGGQSGNGGGSSGGGGGGGGNPTEYAMLSAPVAGNTTYAQVAAGIAVSVIDANGYVGTNRPGTSGTIYPDFDADEQRSAFDNMLSGVITGNDTDVSKSWLALQTTYAHQTSDGDFAGTPSNGSASRYRGSDSMHFFMAWSCHALTVLLQSPYAAKTPQGSTLTYSQLINGTGSGAQPYGVMPQIKLALDFLTSHETHDYTTDPLAGDFWEPNRSMINANAFAFCAKLVQNYAAAASSLSTYDSHAQWWINNIFVASAYPPFNNRPLVNPATGVFYEGNAVNGFGYDSSYQGVAASHAMPHAYDFPDHFHNAGVDPVAFAKAAGRFLGQRLLPTNPQAGGASPAVDDTDDTRTGPTPVDAENKAAAFDTASARKAMIFYAAQFNRPDSLAALVGNPGANLIWGLPPAIFNDPDALKLSLTSQAAMAPYTVYATNSGIQSGATQTLDPLFVITASGLPPGLHIGAPYSYPQNAALGAGNLDQGIGMADINGTPTQSGTYAVTLTATNKYGTGSSLTLTIVVQ